MEIGVVMLGVAVAILFYWKARKIPNSLTFSMMVCGLVLHTVQDRGTGFLESLFGLSAGIFFLYLPFKWGGIGGGDVKLMGAIGSLLGPVSTLQVFLASAIFGGVFSLLEIVQNRAVRKTLRGIRDRLLYVALTKRMPPEDLASTQELKIPYAFAIGCGTLFVLCVIGGG